MPGYAILDAEHRPVPADMMTWSRMFSEIEARRVALTHLPNGICVSTVFLGVDHNFGHGSPQWFETMVFGETGREPFDEVCERYETWEQAEAGHAEIVNRFEGDLSKKKGQGQ